MDKVIKIGKGITQAETGFVSFTLFYSPTYARFYVLDRVELTDEPITTDHAELRMVETVFLCVSEADDKLVFALSFDDAEAWVDQGNGFYCEVKPLRTVIDRLVVKIKHTSMSDLPALYERTDNGNLIEAARRIDQSVEFAVREATYLDERACGNNHKGAVKKQNTRARQVRRTQGYNVTHDLNF